MIAEYTAIGATYHHAYGVATYVRNNIDHAHLISCSSDDNVHNVTVKIENIIIVNVYKPPVVPWPNRVLPVIPHPTIYLADFDSQHEQWRYSDNNENGLKLADWAEENKLYLIFDAKEKGTFKSGVWGTETNPDLCFVKCDNSSTAFHIVNPCL